MLTGVGRLADDFLPGLDPGRPQTDDDWFAKWTELSELFSPTAPVRETDLFVGRQPQIARVTDGVFQGGQHVVIYGERGVGKTSLINIIRNKVFAASRRIKFFAARCLTGQDFVAIWEQAFADHRWADGTVALDGINHTLDPNRLFQLISRFNANERPVFIFDEFDRIEDEHTKLQMAETIKLLSDVSPYSTIIIVGVARTVRGLISEHPSIGRAVKQVGMPRMSSEEISEIVKLRIERAAMVIEPDALETIVWLSRGMPAFAHLLGLYSARHAIFRKKLTVDDAMVIGCLQVCLDEVDETTREAYAKATQSAKPGNLLRETLLACAITAHDEFGRFIAASLRRPLGRIFGRPREISDFNRHLKGFCSYERGNILEREGTPKNYHYRFVDPLMQSFVMMKGVRDGMLSKPNVC